MDSKFRKKKEVKIIDNIICDDICCDETYLLNEIVKNTSIETPENIPEIIDENSANYTEKCPKKRGDIQYQCSLCDIQFTRKDNYDRHLFTQKHMIKTTPTSNIENEDTLRCNVCNITYNSKKDLKRHFGTKKHLINIGELQKSSIFKCDICNIVFNKKTILNKHILSKSHIVKEGSLNNGRNKTNKKKVEDTMNSETLAYLDIINKMLVENKELRNFFVGQNQELIKVMVEQNTKLIESSTKTNSVSNNTSNIIHGNVNNHRFNINFFLNEHCKDAINLPDFIENIEVSHIDLENNAQLGFVDGISKIILDNMKQLSVYERPIHCTDTKRETMYIKCNDKWSKEDSEEKLHKAIQNVSYKGIGVLNEWKESNPEYKDINSDFSEKCLIMTKHTMAGYNRDSFYPKIIKNISKETVLDKTQIE
jgi:uncharacterized C2H2 Zn-finger protein